MSHNNALDADLLEAHGWLFGGQYAPTENNGGGEYDRRAKIHAAQSFRTVTTTVGAIVGQGGHVYMINDRVYRTKRKTRH